MIWAWLSGSRIGRALSAIGVAVMLLVGLIAQQRRDARNDALRDARERDQDNANDVRSRVRDVPDRVRDYNDRGWRD
jgi:hypothetical protein